MPIAAGRTRKEIPEGMPRISPSPIRIAGSTARNTRAPPAQAVPPEQPASGAQNAIPASIVLAYYFETLESQRQGIFVSESLSIQERQLLSTPIRDEPSVKPRSTTLNLFPGNRDDDEFETEVSKEQLDAIESFHQSVAKRFSIALSDLLQRIVDVQLRCVEVVTYSKFIFSRATPTCLITLRAQPLRESLGIDFSPAILYPLIDCLLGGNHNTIDIPSRPMTQIEQRLASRITMVLLEELHDAWEHVLAVQLAIDHVESNAQRVRLVAPSEQTITLTFETRIAEQVGEIALCLPLRASHKMIARLCGTAESGTPGAAATGQSDSVVRATLGPITIAASDLDKLQPGELLITDLPANTNATVSIDNEDRFEARPASLHGNKAIVIE